MRRFQLLIACGLVLLLAIPAVAREWSDASGKFKIEAELADVSGGAVRLKKPTGELSSITIAKLSPADQDYVKQALARSTAAGTVLKKHCYTCHGEGGSDEGGMNYILNGARLVEKGQVIAGQPEKSLLLKRIAAGKMPPEDVATRPSKDEIEILRDWITQGAFSPSGTAAREFVTNDKVMEAVAADLATADERSRVFYRYFSITHLYNAGLADEELQTMRLALSKLLNSLSWDRKILTPKPVDPAQTVFRIDVRDLRWTKELWEALALVYPYNIQFSGKAAVESYRQSATRTPVLRADWFVAHASSPPLYHALLQMPTTLQGLQQQLKINFAQNLRQDRANRAGFTNSGISVHPRVIERHESSDGACWVSYDFAASAGNRNFFNNPLGFDYDGGEIIFSLPNGLQAYMIVNREGQRLDKAPTKIVRDLKSLDATVVNGISCMRCHASGILPKHDEVRKHAQTNSKVFGAEKLKTILAVYPEHDVLDKQIKEDQDRFKDGMDKIGITRLSAEGEPIYNMAQRHLDPIDLRMAAAEVGKTPEEFRAALDKLVTLQRVVGPLRVGSTIPRDVFEESFGTVVSFLSVGRHLPPGGRIVEPRDTTGSVAPEPGPAEGPATPVEDPLGVSPGPDLKNGLVHHWRFDETKGDTARDSVGKLNATLVNYGPADKRWAKGKIGNAILFSKPQQGAFLTKDIDFPQLTIAVWLNVIQESGINPRIAFPWLTLSYNQKRGVSIFYQVMEPTKPKVGEWNHYAVTIDQETMTATIYKNGEEVASGKHEGRDGKIWAFGHSSDLESHRDSLCGLLDDLRIYKRLLKVEEVAKLAGVKIDTGPAIDPAPQPAPPDEPATTVAFPENLLTRGDESAATPGLPKIAAPEISGQQVINFDEPLANMTVGGAGRYWVFYFKGTRKLALFDVSAAGFVKEIDAPAEDMLLAASLDKLIIAIPSNNVVSRYDLATLVREQSTSFTGPSPRTLLVGGASKGPLVVWGQKGPISLYDVNTLKPLTVKGDLPGGDLDYQFNLTISSDGQTLCDWEGRLSRTPFRVTRLAGNTATIKSTGRDFRDAARWMRPSYDGFFCFVSGGVILPPSLEIASASQFSGMTLHSAEDPNYFLAISKVGEKSAEAWICSTGSLEKIARVPDIGHVCTGRNVSEHGHFGPHLRVRYIPSANILLSIPEGEDKLILSEANVRQILKERDADYLHVLSNPPRTAWIGRPYRYQAEAVCNKPSVTFKLESGPPGFSISPEGIVSWTPKQRPASGVEKIVIAASAEGGQESLHAFEVAVEKPVIVRPPSTAKSDK